MTPFIPTRPVAGLQTAVVAQFLLVALLATGRPALANDDFTDAVQQAYGPYRIALFKTSNGTLAEARAAVDAGAEAWARVASRYRSGVGVPYATDSHLPQTLDAVTTIWGKSKALVDDSKAADAHEALEGIRDALAEMRGRNQVIVFSDHMNAYHEEMEKALAIDTSGNAWPTALAGHAAVLRYLAARLKQVAPQNLRADADFNSLLGNVASSLESLDGAIAAQDLPAMRAALGKLKPPYAKLFLRFG